MNCGNKYVINQRPEEFILGIRTGAGNNGLIKINEDTWINPSNISSIQMIKHPSLAAMR